jgi:hypothetical protein
MSIDLHLQDPSKLFQKQAEFYTNSRPLHDQDLRTTVTQVTILRGEFNFWLI